MWWKWGNKKNKIKKRPVVFSRAHSGKLVVERSPSLAFTCQAGIQSSPAPSLQPNPAPQPAHRSTTPRKRLESNRLTPDASETQSWEPAHCEMNRPKWWAADVCVILDKDAKLFLWLPAAPFQHDSPHRHRSLQAEADAPRSGPEERVPANSKGRGHRRADDQQQPRNIRRGEAASSDLRGLRTVALFLPF